jgi:hypothetical protein
MSDIIGGCSSELDSETDRKSAATQGSAHSCCQPFNSAPATLTDAEREAIEAAVQIIDAHDEEMDGFPSGAAATLRKLLERLT